MKIALAQINPIVGDLKGNQKKIIEAISKSKKEGADIVLFSELSLIGYPPEDLLLLPSFIVESEKILDEIILETKNITVILGTIRKNSTKVGKPLFNTAAIISDQKMIGYQDKILLPTYDVFDERRYFEPGSTISCYEIHGKKVAITICEDIWQDTDQKTEFSDSRYHLNPVLELKKFHPDIVLNLSASPFCKTHFKSRMKVAKEVVKMLEAPLYYCNQVGANDSLIFDGFSFCMNRSLELIAISKGFQEDLIFIDDSKTNHSIAFESDPLKNLYEALVLGVKDYFSKSGFKKAILGLSGGIDSALVACIASEALGSNNVLCLMMPSRYSSPESLLDAKSLIHHLGVESEQISIEEPFDAYLKLLEPKFQGKPFDVTEENLQARIRGMILMAFSNKFQSIVLSTGNKSELALGYCTLYGDMCGGLSVIADVTKSEVYELANWINRDREIIPWNTIHKAPSAELKFNQKDQDTLPDYAIIDHVLEAYLEDHLSVDQIIDKFSYSRELVSGLIKKIHQNEYKRKQAPPGLRVSNKAFTVGRRFPIVQKWV